jgi:hypothetical protein
VRLLGRATKRSFSHVPAGVSGIAASLASQRSPVLPSISTFRPPTQRRHAVIVAAIALVASAWPVFVFADSQAAYVVAVVVSVALAASLARNRSFGVVLLLVAELALLGPEVNGSLAAGTPPLGHLRILDATAAASVVVLAPQLATTLRRRPPGILALASFAVGVWAVGLWFVHGRPRDGLVKADLRVAGLAVATFGIAAVVRRPSARQLVFGLGGIAALASAKALAIYFTRFWTIGSFDRLQASLSASPSLRSILVGGDTVLTVAPAVAAIGVLTLQSKRDRLAAAGAGALTLAAVFAAGTRTGLVVAVGTTALVAVAIGRGALRRLRARELAVIVAVLAIALLGAIAFGVAGRFTTADAPHVGLNFREDEARLFFRLPARDILLGQGVGGRFLGKDVNGGFVVTGWMHEFPLWLLLKGGVAAALVGVALAAAALRAGWRGAARGRVEAAGAGTGLALVFGVLVLSLTLGRAALPEGSMLLGLAAGLLWRRGDA